MSVSKFQARHATVAYTASATAWDASTLIDGESMTSVSEVKNITVSPPEQGVEQVPCLGWLAQTIGINSITPPALTGITPSENQCMALCKTNTSNWKFEGTLVLTGDEQAPQILGLGTSQAITGGVRYAVGDLASSVISHNLIGCMRIYLNNGAEKMSVGMSNVWVTKIGDIKPTSADGHFEIDFSAECLPQNGAIEWLT